MLCCHKCRTRKKKSSSTSASYFRYSRRPIVPTRKESLAIIRTVEHFHKYLYGREFLIRTDHAALTWLLQMKNPEGQVARWLERLQQYHFKIRHRAGKLHNNADSLSRRPCKNCKHCDKIEQYETVFNCGRTVVIEEE